MSTTLKTAPLALLLACAALARGETVTTKDGQHLVGEIVDETQDELVLRTRYGTLVVPTASIASVEGRPGAAATADGAAPEVAPLDLAKLGALRLKARRSAQRGDRAAAQKGYEELLALDPNDPEAHLELGVVLAQAGRGPDAVASLRRAILAGYGDLAALRKDERLGALRTDPAFLQLMGQRAGLLRIAARRVPDHLARALRARGARAPYAVVPQDPDLIVYLNGLAAPAFAAVRKELELFTSMVRGQALASAPAAPLFVVLLAEQDRAVLGGAQASFDPVTATLTCAPFPAGSLARAPLAQRELTRALQAIDRQGRQEPVPAWLEEGLLDLLGVAGSASERFVFRPSALVGQVKSADRGLPALLTLDRKALEQRGARLACRYLVEFLASKDPLNHIYDECSRGFEAAGPDGARKALEAALSSTLPDLDAAWRAWLAQQAPASVPFTGLLASATAQGLRVTYVQAESGAARAGLVEGDVVTAVDGAPVRSDDDLREVLALRAVGQEVELDLVRDGDALRARLTLAATPAGPIGPLRDQAPYLGMAVDQAEGGPVKVASIDADSPAARAGLKVGDAVVSLDGAEVGSVRAWLRALRGKQAGQRAALVVERAGARVTVEVELAPFRG